jgi:hypothetical protein
MTANPYRTEIDELKKELLEGLNIAREFTPDYTELEFSKIIASECHRLNIKFNAIRRSGGHADDNLRIAIFAHKELAEELGGEKITL